MILSKMLTKSQRKRVALQYRKNLRLIAKELGIPAKKILEASARVGAMRHKVVEEVC